MRVLHIVNDISIESGGIAKVVNDLTEKLNLKGIEVVIFSTFKSCKKLKTIQPKGVKLQLFPENFIDKAWASYSSSFARSIKQEVYKFDIIHIHGIWHYPHYIAYKVAKQAGKPFIISIHGALDPWCLNYKFFKKKIYALLVQKHILQEASFIHAITNEEINQIKNFVANKNITMIPNGINPEEYISLPSRRELEKLYPELINKKVILFLGRIHPKKGLDLLVNAFAEIVSNKKGIFLLIAGPDNDGYKTIIEKNLKEKGILNKVIFTGMLKGREKIIALSGSDIFVLPSYSEGFSMAILEAMICKLPVIITRQCNFPEISKVGAGIMIEPDSTQLAQALTKLLTDPKVCNKMGENGYKLILKKYTWDKIADQMIKLYEEILS